MLRSLPSLSRFLPAILLTLIITIILYKSIFPTGRHHHAFSSSDQCSPNDDNCDATDNLIKPPSRQEFEILQHTLQSLKEDIEKLKVKEPPKILTPDEQLWESRRTECGDGVLRNIDYQHVLSLYLSANNRASCMNNSGHRHQNHSGIQKRRNGRIM
jgi:hypothetical protein